MARACRVAGVAKLPPLQATTPLRRYERQSPGELLHLDTKKLARFDQPGYRVTGDRIQNTPRAGWQALHVAIDDPARVVFSQVLTDETASCACAFLLDALRQDKQLGVRVERVMTDNGSAYKSMRFARLIGRLGIQHIRTRPNTPRTNGKAERFIQTLLRAWAYADFYPSPNHRTVDSGLDAPLQLSPASLGRRPSSTRHAPWLRREQRVEKLQLARSRRPHGADHI